THAAAVRPCSTGLPGRSCHAWPACADEPERGAQMAVIEERQMKRWLLLIFLSCAGGAWAQLAPVGADPVVDEIRIRSTWGGLSPDSPLITELVVRRSDGGFTMTGTSSRAGKLTAM